MKKSTFTAKLMGYNLILFVSILLVAVLTFYFWVVRDTEARAKEDFETLAEKTASQFDNLVYNMDRTALQIAANPNIVSWFGKIPKEGQDNYFISNPLLAADVVQLLNSYNFKKDGNTRICLYNDFGDFVYSATTMTTTEGVEGFFDSEDFRAVQQHFQGNNVFSMLRSPGKDILNTSELPSPDYFSVIRQIKDYFSGTQKNGYVEVQQSVEKMDEIFSHLGSNCYAVVCDAQGRIIYRSPSLDGQTEAERFLQNCSPADFPLGASVQDGDFVARYQTEEAPLDILFYKQADPITAPMNQFVWFLVVVFFTACGVTVFSERLLINRLSRPLVELNRSVQNVNIDNLRLELDNADASDELQSLNQAFNAMLQHLKVAIDQRVLSQTNELKAHLFALQSQMNPHFLYNTLAIINMEAEMDGNEKTVMICQALAQMLKYSSSMGDGMATLEEELRHANNYMELMKQRYEDGFVYTIEQDDSLRELKVSKLMIQPLCENCFKHAFGEIEDVRRITVRTFRTANQWRVTVEDNGCGVTEEVVREFQEFKKSLSLETMQQQLHAAALGGLSLTNTCMRLYLVYGKDFVFTMQNTGHGTLVTLGGNLPCSE